MQQMKYFLASGTHMFCTDCSFNTLKKKSLACSTQSGYKKKKKWIRHSHGPWEAY